MALHVVATRSDGSVFTLPWSTPLAEWDERYVVPAARGLSRHVVRIVRVDQQMLAVKETDERIAFREYRLLRELQRLGQPVVVARAVVTGRRTEDGTELPAALVTDHLHYSLPYRTLFQHGMQGEQLPLLVDALVVLLVRLHLAAFHWGDVSLSNALFRRDAGGFAAFLVDAETGELHPTLSEQMREHDVAVGLENVFAELLDLQAAGDLDPDVAAHDVVELLSERYRALWQEVTAAEEFDAAEWWRVEERLGRLNDLGFDVDELDVRADGERVRITPKAVEAGHHRRELRELTGLNVEDEQARKLLNDLAAFTAAHDLGALDRATVARRWLTTVYTPLVGLVPAERSAEVNPPEYFHEVMEHRWRLSEQAGYEVDIFGAATDFIEHVLPNRPPDVQWRTDATGGPGTGSP
ncbi:DUF4032 domain-containing protein [Nocardioides panacisoli]|uniref:DUF4032 domain-containing protein n=1 Tax=Nocardioides panacisoli TaxID=627624 RepID=UPI001C62C30E|nr:DUF4032 domain-containing protein [Nocardioides panacisoli]QYJ02612.1 DUF4032 domain-containing protein [Nocardioides panacisoli]